MQFPLTPAYAFTDYRSQGQTISNAIIDIGTPPCGELTPFSIYVVSSRAHGRYNIRLFFFGILTTSYWRVIPTNISVSRIDIDQRLVELDKATNLPTGK
ncbi:hypothetical protein EDB19DRAFT_1634386 [Suillus lakei]|nr:hypothetical protein EDB19DRAFT_1634386 [Suillus lakei]